MMKNRDYRGLIPPKATSEIRIGGNLDSDSPAEGSILYTQKFLRHAEASDMAVGLMDHGGALQNKLSVSLNGSGSEDNIPDGSIVIRGQPESAFAIKDAAFRAMDWNNAKPSPISSIPI